MRSTRLLMVFLLCAALGACGEKTEVKAPIPGPENLDFGPPTHPGAELAGIGMRIHPDAELRIVALRNGKPLPGAPFLAKPQIEAVVFVLGRVGTISLQVSPPEQLAFSQRVLQLAAKKGTVGLYLNKKLLGTAVIAAGYRDSLQMDLASDAQAELQRALVAPQGVEPFEKRLRRAFDRAARDPADLDALLALNMLASVHGSRAPVEAATSRLEGGLYLATKADRPNVDKISPLIITLTHNYKRLKDGHRAVGYFDTLQERARKRWEKARAGDLGGALPAREEALLFAVQTISPQLGKVGVLYAAGEKRNALKAAHEISEMLKPAVDDPHIGPLVRDKIASARKNAAALEAELNRPSGTTTPDPY